MDKNIIFTFAENLYKSTFFPLKLRINILTDITIDGIVVERNSKQFASCTRLGEVSRRVAVPYMGI